VTATGYWLVIGFINYSQIITTINYNTVPDFYPTKQSTIIFSVYLHFSSLPVSWQRISTKEFSQIHTSNNSHECLPPTLKVFNSHDQIFSNYKPSAAFCYPKSTRKWASVSPINPWSDMRENASIVASLLKRSRGPSPLLRHPSFYSCCLATNEARQCEAMRGDAQLITARLGSTRHWENTASSTVA
jgi:hypothetical protein